MLLMVILFLGGVLFGVDQASEGITKTRGYSDESVQQAVESNISDDGTYQVKVMGQDFQQINVEEKEQKYQQTESSQLPQKLASTLESAVQWVYNQMIVSVYQIVQAFF